MFLLMGFIAVLGHTSCTSKKEEKEPETKFLVTTPLKADTLITKEYVCQIRAMNHIEIRALERGYLQNIYVDEGQFVKKGQLLFRIMPKLYEAELQKAKAEAKVAEIELQNTKSLTDKNIVSANELAMAKAKFDKANGELSLAQVHLGFTEIRAPFDGIIDRFHARLGSLLSEGDLITNLSDNSNMWVYFNVPEAEYLNFSNKERDSKPTVSLVMANNELFPRTGIVETIEADFDNETGTIPFRATFSNPDKLLRHGETGNIRMDQAIKNAMIIPQKATFEVLDKKYVFVVGNDHKVTTREIAVGAEMEDLFIVTSGLREDDKILLEGIRKVKDGDEISYTKEDPRKVISSLKVHAE
jgi:membrane fusion protein (multidrug efflux system)